MTSSFRKLHHFGGKTTAQTIGAFDLFSVMVCGSGWFDKIQKWVIFYFDGSFCMRISIIIINPVTMSKCHMMILTKAYF